MRFLYIYILLFLSLWSGLQAQNPVISQIEIRGNKRTKSNFLKRLAFVKEGSTLDTLRIASDERRFRLLPSVASASSSYEKLNDGSYKLTYTIVENFAIIPGLNVSQDVNEDLAYRVSLFDFNLFGQNQILGGFYSRNVFDSYGFFWEAPNLFTRKLGIGINFQNSVLQHPIFLENESDVNYKFHSKAIELRMFYEHNFNNRFQLGFNYANEEYLYLNGSLPPYIPDNLDLKRFSIVGEYEYNNITNEFQYVEGFRSVFTFNATVDANGNADLLKNTFVGRNDFEYFKRVGAGGNWANRLRLGYASNTNSPFAAFALDNQLNIRGVGNVVDRGSASIVLNTEFRQTLYEKGWFALQGNAFIDAGTWQEPGGEFSDLIDGSNASLFSGLGVRFIHKRIFNAVFRIDYGFSLGDKANSGIVFGIGQYF